MKSFKAEEETRLHAELDDVKERASDLKRIDIQVDERCCEYIQQHPDVSYADALTTVLDADADLKARYNDSFVQHKTAHVAQHAEDDDETEKGAGDAIDKLCQEWLRAHPKETYEKALAHVREQRPDLWRKYAESR